MSDDRWAKGDLALCIRDDWETLDPGYVRKGDEPRKGQILTVEIVGVSDWSGDWAGYLVFAGQRVAYEMQAFRRLPPLSEEERRQALADLPVCDRVPA